MDESKEEITPETFPTKFKPYILDGLPAWLKEPIAFRKVMREYVEMIMSRCGHANPAEWYACRKCLRRIQDTKLFLKKLGFLSMHQFYAWRRTHEIMEKNLRHSLI